ncbi:MAG: cation:proton antiporter [Methanobacteriota archaeon]|nr:MAG: cation:proton antiporter [Euryarchaeota archaeon]
MSMALGTEAIYQQLTILLVLATLSHLTIKRFHQPTIVGEIALGILIGPSVLGFYFNLYPFDQSLVASFAGLGAIFLLFLIGLESDFRAIYTTKNVLVAAGGVALPFVLGFVTAYLLVPSNAVGTSGTQFTMAIFMGATLTATSTAIAASVLLDLGLMREPVAQTIMGAAVVDDILSLVVLSLVVGASRGEVDPLSIGLLVLAALAFIGVGMAVGIVFFRRVVVRIQVEGMKLGLKHGGFIIAMAVTFLYAFVAEIVGLSAVVGAFLAGTLFASTPLREDFTEGAGYLGAIFTPIFFISLGLRVNLPLALGDVALLVFGAVLTVVAILSKVVGCGIPARLTKMTRHEALAVGWGMTPRGEVGLIVALAALSASVIKESLFSVLVVVMILVSVLPAPLFKRALAGVDDERRRARAEAAADPR